MGKHEGVEYFCWQLYIHQSLTNVTIFVYCLLVFAGAPALTTRGFTEEDFERSVLFFDDAVNIAKEAKLNSGQLQALSNIRIQTICHLKSVQIG